jgi:hypothetical protein
MTITDKQLETWANRVADAGSWEDCLAIAKDHFASLARQRRAFDKRLASSRKPGPDYSQVRTVTREIVALVTKDAKAQKKGGGK